MLTEKQIKFANEILTGVNLTQAYKNAGYAYSSDNVAAVAAHKLLNTAKISAYLEQKRTEAYNDTYKVTVESVLGELAAIGFCDVKDFVNGGNSILEIKYLDSQKTRALSGIKTTSRAVRTKDAEGKNKVDYETTTELKFHNKVAALQLMGQHLGIFEKDNSQRKSDPVILNFGQPQKENAG